jgi:homospermidine synthase
MMEGLLNVMLLGASGGIGSAFINILARNDISNSIIPHGTKLVLVDRCEDIIVDTQLREKYVVSVISGVDIKSHSDLETLLIEHQINALIEVADIETIEFVRVCTSLGVLYLNSGYGVWPDVYAREHPRCLMLVRALEIRNAIINRGAKSNAGVILGSGMNPGVVNALVERGIQRLANLNFIDKNELAADLQYIIFTEEDTTSIPESTFDEIEFPITWNPQHAFAEFTEQSTGYISKGRVQWIDSRPLDCRFDVVCNDKIINGMLVPHEESVTLGEKYPNITSGFIYCIPHVSALQLPKVRDLKLIKPVLLVPKYFELAGSDTVGVLLQTTRYGAYWLGYKNYHHEAACYDTNATLMQVAAGVLAGTSILLRPFSRISVIEDLDYQTYLDTVCNILGPIVEKQIMSDQLFRGFERHRAGIIS